MERRDFIKRSCFGCIAIAAGISLLPSCVSLPVYKSQVKEKKIEVDPASFLPENNAILVRVKELPFDILMIKESDSLYKALYLKCSHQDNPLSFSGKKIICNSHGSEFNLEGKALNGPAIENLRSFKVTIADKKIFLTV